MNVSWFSVCVYHSVIVLISSASLRTPPQNLMETGTPGAYAYWQHFWSRAMTEFDFTLTSDATGELKRQTVHHCLFLHTPINPILGCSKRFWPLPPLPRKPCRDSRTPKDIFRGLIWFKHTNRVKTALVSTSVPRPPNTIYLNYHHPAGETHLRLKKLKITSSRFLYK